MKRFVPKCVKETMNEEIVHNALKGTSKALRSYFPEYSLNGWNNYKEYPEEFVRLISGVPDSIQEDLIEEALIAAHDYWRSQPEVIGLIESEACSNCLNIFARLELAGPEIFLLWARIFERLFGAAGFNFQGGHPDWVRPAKGEFSSQLSWLNEVDCMVQPMFREIYVRMRRRFIEGSGLVDKRDLYEYVMEPKNDVLGLNLPLPDGQTHKGQRRHVHDLLYHDWEENITFRLARQIVLANGGGSPIDW